MALGPPSLNPISTSGNPDAINLTQIGGTVIALGQKVMASSVPVTIASDQPPFAVTGTFWQATQPVSGTVTVNAGTNLNTSALALESGGNLDAIETDLDTLVAGINTTLPAGTNVIGHVIVDTAPTTAVTESGTWTVQPGNTQNSVPWLTQPTAYNAAVGPSLSYQSALTNTKTAIKASLGNLYGWHIYNPNNAVTYIQIFNKTTANVTVGTTAPDWVLVVPQQGWLDDLSFSIPVWSFSTAMTIAATTGAANATAPGTNLIADIFYI